MKKIFKVSVLVFFIFMILAGCDFSQDITVEKFSPGLVSARDTTTTAPGNGSMVDGTDPDGFYWFIWQDSGGGTASITHDTATAGNYRTSWSNVNNFTSGKGWPTGTTDKVINYSGSFDGGNNGYLAAYGWMENPLIEYYVIETWGDWDPNTWDALTYKGTINSDGATYNVYTAQRTNAPNITGTDQNFTQYFSIRQNRNSGFPLSGTITMATHFAGWESLGMPAGSFETRDYLVMETEGYQSSGSSDITISDGSSGGGSEGFFSLDGKYVASGSAYALIGEKRYPVTPDGSKNLSGLFTGVLIHRVSGNAVDLELLLVPLDSSTDAQIRAIKDPPDSAYAGMSPSAAAGARARNWCYNASDLAVTAFRGMANVTDGGMTINLGNFNFNGIQVNNMVMTYIHVSDTPGPGIPYSEIKYNYTYTVSGRNMVAEAIIFVAENPSSIPSSRAMIIKENLAPAAMVSGGNYSFISVWSGKHVTVTATGNNALVKAQPVNEGWTSQDWTAEFVSGKDNVVRIKNIWTGKYLHAQANYENAKAVCYDLRTDWLSEQWEIEQTGFDKVRLRNMWTNRYLTVVDTGDFADIILKQLNTGWTSQEWKVDWLLWKE